MMNMVCGLSAVAVVTIDEGDEVVPVCKEHLYILMNAVRNGNRAALSVEDRGVDNGTCQRQTLLRCPT